MFRFIHCSDWQLPMPADQVTDGRQLKQRLSRVSWTRRRRWQHREDVLEAAMRVWCGAGIDRVCVTGDLVNFALPVEFAAAAACLRRIEATAPVSLVPGNHDALVRTGLDEQRRAWKSWMPKEGGQSWPLVTLQGPVAFIGLSSGIPTPPFFAQGAVAASQLAELEQLLPRLRQQGYFRVVMVHHPPQAGAIGWRSSLRNAEALREVLRRGGAELVLHGHLHRPVRAWLPGITGPIPVMGAGSASSCRAHGRTERGHFHLFTIEPATPQGWRLWVTNYFYDAARGSFEPGAAEEVVWPDSRARSPDPAAELNPPSAATPASSAERSLRVT